MCERVSVGRVWGRARARGTNGDEHDPIVACASVTGSLAADACKRRPCDPCDPRLASVDACPRPHLDQHASHHAQHHAAVSPGQTPRTCVLCASLVEGMGCDRRQSARTTRPTLSTWNHGGVTGGDGVEGLFGGGGVGGKRVGHGGHG